MTDTTTVDLTPSEILTRAADLIRDTAAAAAQDGEAGPAGVVDADSGSWIDLLNPSVAGPIEGMLRAAVSEIRAIHATGGFSESVDRYIADKFGAALAFARAVLGLVDTPKEDT